MRLARIRRAPEGPVELAAALDDQTLVSLREVDAEGDPLAALDRLGLDGLRAAAARLAVGGERLAVSEVIFETPVAACSKVCCLALNYRAHADESSLDVPPVPVLFFKPPSALVGHGATVRPPERTAHVEHEVELAVVIGRRCRDVAERDWAEVVAGYTIVNDMTARDLQLESMRRQEPWDHSKAFDTFAPLGPFLVTPDEVPDPHALTMTLTVDGEVRQHAHTGDMVHRIPRLIADLTDGMTLLPGDVIATGTTAGIAPVQDGDVMHASIDGLGTLVSPVQWK
ncbi:fumarylacetoacetate hydrolase family protein [Jiangella endophytica]|uniref:fumarylacetoacetate hydrolase family protein n=1 Tax=Jiangella endophytica TaxID=1623398 RepID=UPI0018E4E271|nr:fumarylacetoacetate hydrolase family protein [Jiangella endophytica]